MSSPAHPNYFPLTKGTLLLMAIVLFFATLMLAICLWYDVQVRAIDNQIESLPQKEKYQIPNH